TPSWRAGGRRRHPCSSYQRPPPPCQRGSGRSRSTKSPGRGPGACCRRRSRPKWPPTWSDSGARETNGATRWWFATGRPGLAESRSGRERSRLRLPGVNDRRVNERGERQRFTSEILPPYMRRSPQVAEVLPVLYLRGLSTGDFKEALPALLGE